MFLIESLVEQTGHQRALYYNLCNKRQGQLCECNKQFSIKTTNVKYISIEFNAFLTKYTYIISFINANTCQYANNIIK